VGCGAKAHNAAVAISQSWQEILDGEMKLLVIAGLCRYRGNRPCELPILGIIGIRNDLYRRHHIDGKVDGRAAGHGVSYVRAIHQRSALSVASALEIDVAIGPSQNSGNQRKRTLKPFVHVGSIT